MLGIGNLIFKDGVADYLNSRMELIGRHKDIFLFGSARGGQKAFDYFRKYGFQKKVVHVVDNDPMKQGKKFNGIEIISAEVLQKVFGNFDDAIIVIASGSAHIIKRQLLALGIPTDKLIDFVITNLEMEPTPFQFFSDNKEAICKAYEVLADEKSKTVFIALLNFKMTRDSSWLKNIADDEDNQYFDEITRMSAKESFVDCGAYIGDTLDLYRLKYGGWKNYYCLEADPDVFNVLKKHVEELKCNNVYLFNIGCWDKETTLCFAQLGSGSSSISDKQDVIRVPVSTIDNILYNHEVSVIKMDIEGAEQNALSGAANVINRYHPKLAISIYHSLNDFIQIPRILSDYGNGYKIYIRHYRELTDSETICYAV